MYLSTFFTEKLEKNLNMSLCFSQENHQSSFQKQMTKDTEETGLIHFDLRILPDTHLKNIMIRAVHCHRETNLSNLLGFLPIHQSL